MTSTPTPKVGDPALYQSYGTPKGEYSSLARAAVITEVDPEDATHVGLAVFNPSGLFFHGLKGETGGIFLDDSEQPKGGTWRPVHRLATLGEVEYPFASGDVTVLGPEVFAAKDGSVICWQGVNYVPQNAPQD